MIITGDIILVIIWYNWRGQLYLIITPQAPPGFDWSEWRDILDDEKDTDSEDCPGYEFASGSTRPGPRLSDWQRQEMISGRWRTNTAPARMDNMAGTCLFISLETGKNIFLIRNSSAGTSVQRSGPLRRPSATYDGD